MHERKKEVPASAIVTATAHMMFIRAAAKGLQEQDASGEVIGKVVAPTTEALQA